MTSRALSFGAAAAAYEKFRPGYPDELVDLVLDYAGRPVRTALEIGAGTGKATRAFATREIEVTATDPDPAMLAELRLHVPDSVRTVQAALEDLPPNPTHDLVYVAAALHWTDQEQRWSRIANLLAPGGCFANLGGETDFTDPDIATATHAIHRRFVPDIEVHPHHAAVDGEIRWPGSELEQSELFEDVREVRLSRELSMSAEDHIGHLSTVSAYLQLPDSERSQAFAEIRRAIPDQVELRAELMVHLARLS
jgi:SAM-dependent methyltransferase